MEFDVFLSHNSKDKTAVEQIGVKLQEQYGWKCWLDKWNLVPGEPWQEALEAALDECQTVAVFVGPNTISPWENEEMRSALEERVRDKSRRVIPVLLPGAPDNRDLKLPRFLTRLTWVDLRININEDALYLLYCGIKGIAPEQGIGKKNTIGSLPIGSHIPFLRNHLFTGREKELEGIANSLLGKKPSVTLISQAIIGMGGIGKTQLAVEFAYQYGYLFKGVHWLDLRDTGALDNQIVLCGEKMDFRYWPKEQPEQVSLTLRTWQTDGPRLLILDNLENIQEASHILARFQNQNLRLLITSRHSDWPVTLGLQPLSLDVFTDEESIVFLKKYTKERFTNDDLKKLAIRLGELPLALELAGRYLDLHPRLSIDEYLNKISEALEHPSMRGFRKDLPNPTGHELDLLATFALSWLQVRYNVAKNIFMIAGYCAPNTTIPYEIFEGALSIDETTCDEELTHLIGLGLVKDNTSLHPLLAEYSQYLDQDKALLSSLTQALVKITKDKNKEVDKSGNYSLFGPLISHLQLITEKSDRNQIPGASSLWYELGYHIKDLEDFVRAKTAFERALKIDEATLGPDHLDVARDVNYLGIVLERLGDFQGAKTAHERALKIHETTLGPDHPDVARDVHNIGVVLRDSGDFQGAKTAHEHALKIHETALGPDHPDVATSVSSLGNVLISLGDLQGAKTAYERALKIHETALGPDHPDVARDVNSLGNVLFDLGDPRGAKTAFERALKIDEAVFGLDHPAVARDINSISAVLHNMGDFQGAKTAYERALKIHETALGPDHPDVATAINNLGNVLRDMGDLQGAKEAFERALKIHNAALGPDHPNIAGDLNNIGTVLLDMGDLQGAKTAYERALKIHETALGPDHPDVATAINNLGNVLRNMGDLQGAKEAFERALPIYEKTYKNTFHTAQLLRNLAAINIEMGKPSIGLNYLHRASVITIRTLPHNHPLKKEIQEQIQIAQMVLRNPTAFRRIKRKH
jgi:tetratricopeptide (TPR) repeat protein